MEFTGERFIPDCGLEAEIELEHLQRYLSVQDIVAGKRVLDVASGAGYGTALLAERADYAFGIDIDLEAVTFARSRYNAANLEYCQSTLAALPFPDDSFDAVVSFETIEHVTDDLHKKFLEEILRVLVPAGFLVISTPDKHIYSELAGYQNEFHLREYYRQEFNDFLKRFFPNVYLLDQLQELAYTLTDNKADFCKVLRRKSSSLTGKYIIALCGCQEIPDPGKIGSVIFDTEDAYQKKIDRIIELQGEIVEKNQNIADVLKMIHDRDAKIAEIASELTQIKKRLFAQVEQKREKVAELEAKEHEIANLQIELNTMREKVDSLSASLSHIYSTKAWWIIQRAYQLKNKIWPL